MLKPTGVTTNGVFGVQLVRDVGMVLAGATLADSGFHQPGERWQDVNWWVNTAVVELTINEDLSL
jgi:hypothetical protein